MPRLTKRRLGSPLTKTGRQKRHFGKRLREARLRLGYSTARDFAASLGELESTVSMWERGERLPRLDKLLLIKRATGRSLDWLLLGDANSGPSRKG